MVTEGELHALVKAGIPACAENRISARGSAVLVSFLASFRICECHFLSDLSSIIIFVFHI
jgi:hypothetical protein